MCTFVVPAPSCVNSDKAQTCPQLARDVPSFCSSSGSLETCCESCVEYYYERKANGMWSVWLIKDYLFVLA